MVKPMQWFWKVIVSVMFGALILALIVTRSLLESSAPSPQKNGSREPAPPASSVTLALAGTASCSARGCHGAVEPGLDREKCGQNEYNLWAHDRHADAYRVLFGERAQNISRLLGGPKPKKAHEDPRCLACHTNPLLAALSEEHPFAREEILFGVGCESCHGSAKLWLADHTAADWRVKKRSYPMPDLTDPAVVAKTCAGCHVGAPPDKDLDLPLRDVNHDLIAAGHPRLNFEFGAYQANMPAHWRPRQKPEAHFWAVGQIVSAQAALELLTYRAKAGPWPEFAEYDCFACHRSLAPITRGLTPLGSPSRRPGDLPWGSWYFALTDQLVGESAELKSLRTIMQKPNANRGQAAAAAQGVVVKLKNFHAQQAGAKRDLDDPALNRKRLAALVKNSRSDAVWDDAEQRYLALHALNESQRDTDVAAVLQELTLTRAFPPGFDGPVSWPPGGKARFDSKDFFERLQRLR